MKFFQKIFATFFLVLATAQTLNADVVPQRIPAALQEKRFLVSNGQAMLVITASGEVLILGEPTEEAITIAAMLKQVLAVSCRMEKA